MPLIVDIDVAIPITMPECLDAISSALDEVTAPIANPPTDTPNVNRETARAGLLSS